MQASENTELPQGVQPITSNETINFEKIVSDSQKNIANELNAPPKRGRGRPRKVRPEQASSSMSQPVGSAEPSASLPQAPQIDITPILRDGVKLPFEIAAGKLKDAEIRLRDDEAQGPAEIANQLLNVYMPDLQNQDPKKVLAWSFAISMGMLVVRKTQIHQANKAKNKEEPDSDVENPEQNVNSNDSLGVPADSFFAKRTF
jgi:hypothetical protein